MLEYMDRHMRRVRPLILALMALSGCGGDMASAPEGGATRLLATAASSFGATAANGYITVDSGAGLVFKVRQSNGDITSIRYNGGAEMQQQDKGSHLVSGLGSSTVTTYSVAAGVVKITLSTATVTHYLLVREGENNIYMGTYITAEPSVGELRWITRLSGIYDNVPEPSNNLNAVGNIESEDVKGLANGETRSKYFGNQRAIDLTYRGVTRPGVGVFMLYGNRESSSGGPFYNDIQNQSGNNAEVYNYMNSGHNQTEANRMGFHGPYVLMFTNGSQPVLPSVDWMEDQNLTGMVPRSARGAVIGAGLAGMNPAYPYTVAFANSAAQYWAKADPATGAFNSPNMKPGTYTMTVYKGEYAVWSESVAVTAGGSTPLPARSVGYDPSNTAALWRIGDWDGTPNEFLNGPRLRDMHPSDVRQLAWARPAYVVGSSTPANDFSPYQWRGINGTVGIRFKLRKSQIAPLTLRVGITVAQAGGRPRATVNGWVSAVPAASSQPDSRSITLGSFRGNNRMYSYNIPASELVVGDNIISLGVSSGSSGSLYLSPAYAFDAIDLIPTP